MSTNTVFKVNAADRDGPTWARLEKHLVAKLQFLRAENDKHSLDALATARVRGRIEEVKALLDAAKEDPLPLPRE